jgi:TPR repeat protein
MKVSALCLWLCAFSSARAALPADLPSPTDASTFTLTLAAANHGDARAEYELGLIYNLGSGVPQSEELARRWYAKAADQGLACAQNNLGVLYRDGIGNKRDPRKAYDYFKQAAEQADVKGEFNLGIAYATGSGVAIDYAAAAGWLSQAAEAGYQKASFSLAVLYAQGKGVTQNLIIADALLNVAASEGSLAKAPAQAAKVALEKQLSATDLRAARELTRKLAEKDQFARALLNAR